MATNFKNIPNKDRRCVDSTIIPTQEDYSLDSQTKRELEDIKSLLKKSDRSNRLQEYISQPNVQAFNLKLLENGFNKVVSRDQFDVPSLFNNPQCAIEEINDFFKSCGENKMFPSVASFCAFTGVSKEELFYYTSHPDVCPTANILKEFLSQCHSMLENATLNDKVDTRLYGLLASNYYAMQAQSTLYVVPSLENKANYVSQSVQVIKDQMKSESASESLKLPLERG